MIRVVLPPHLRTLAQVGSEVALEVERPVTQRSVLDALESRYPMLRGTIRDHVTRARRPFLRFFVCSERLVILESTGRSTCPKAVHGFGRRAVLYRRCNRGRIAQGPRFAAPAESARILTNSATYEFTHQIKPVPPAATLQLPPRRHIAPQIRPVNSTPQPGLCLPGNCLQRSMAFVGLHPTTKVDAERQAPTSPAHRHISLLLVAASDHKRRSAMRSGTRRFRSQPY